MAKKNVKLSSLGRQHTKENLRRFYPWLNDDFRTIKKSEIKDWNVFHQLFPNASDLNIEWLNALYQYQQCDTKHKTTSSTDSSVTGSNESKD